MSDSKSKPLVIVCVGSHPQTARLISASKRKATRLQGQWVALFIETPEYFNESSDKRQRTLEHLQFAESYGAQIVRLPAQGIASGIQDYITSQDPESCHLYIGQPGQGVKWLRWMPKIALAERVKAHMSECCRVYTIALTKRSKGDKWIDLLQMRALRWRDVVISCLAVGGAYFTAEMLRLGMGNALFRLNDYNLSLLFLVPIVFLAIRFGLIPSLIASLASFFIINYFYIPPYYSFGENDLIDIINLSLFLVTSIIVSMFGSYTYAHVETARKRERRTQALFEINSIVSRAQDRSTALKLLHKELTELLELEVAFFLPETMNLHELEQAYPHRPLSFNAEDSDALHHCWNDMVATGMYSRFYRNAHWRFEPMVTTDNAIGILAFKIPQRMMIDISFVHLLGAMADQCASVIERLELSRDLEAKRISEEREKLRSMLLSSVSHDLKTPLASIIGSLSVYHGMYESLSPERRLQLTETALDEAQRLDSFISNILDMTRIESGQIRLKEEYLNPLSICDNVRKRLKQRLRKHQVVIHPVDEEYEVEADPVLTEQVLQNLLDNAAKYSPEGTVIDVKSGVEDGAFFLSVCDHGKGIPEEMMPKIFDKYERLNHSDTKVAGTGLGLAISKAIMDAQGGSIHLANAPDGGAVFTLRFTNWRQASAQNNIKEST